MSTAQLIFDYIVLLLSIVVLEIINRKKSALNNLSDIILSLDYVQNVNVIYRQYLMHYVLYINGHQSKLNCLMANEKQHLQAKLHFVC